MDHLIDRLLHRRSTLASFLGGTLALSPDEADALASVDHEELVATAQAVRRDLMSRNHRGNGTLRELYAGTLGDLTDAAYEELIADFMESDAFDAYREVPFAGLGLSLEESFYRYCEARGVGAAVTREQEFLAALVKALLLSPRADFLVPAVIRPCPRGVFAVGQTTLFAALGDRLVTGPLTPFLVDLLVSPEPPAEVAARHDVAPADLERALAELRTIGLI